MMNLIRLLVIFFVLSAAEASGFGCLNQYGHFVDWWVIYKEFNGLKYVYMDSTMNTPLGLHPDREIDSITSPLYRTVISTGFTESAKNVDSPSYLAWNDQPFKNITVSKSYAHSKGFMGLKTSTETNAIESFLIQHSLPRFPLAQASSIFDSNLVYRAQHFICVSMRDHYDQQYETTRRSNSSANLRRFSECNFFKLFSKYLKTVNVSVSHIYMNSFIQNLYESANLFPVQDELNSFSIESTGDEATRLKFQIFAKSSRRKIDIYDDVTSLFSIHHEDYGIKEGIPIKTGNNSTKTAMLMIAQSHTDPSTLGINQKLLFDEPSFYATVHILNASSVSLPVEGSSVPKQHMSVFRDHSKWSVNVIYGVEGSFPALLCFYDLNRSNKQIERGGGAFCLNSTLTGSNSASMTLWGLFMSFQAKPTNMARFTDSDVKVILREVEKSSGKHILYENGYPKAESIKSINDVMATIQFLGKRNEENNVLRITNCNSQLLSNIPCPYKFKKAEKTVQQNTNENVPTRTVLQIFNSVYRYSYEKINASLRKYKLFISYLDDKTVRTPASSSIRQLADFTPEGCLHIEESGENYSRPPSVKRSKPSENDGAPIQTPIQKSLVQGGEVISGSTSNIMRNEPHASSSSSAAANSDSAEVDPDESFSNENESFNDNIGDEEELLDAEAIADDGAINLSFENSDLDDYI